MVITIAIKVADVISQNTAEHVLVSVIRDSNIGRLSNIISIDTQSDKE